VKSTSPEAPLNLKKKISEAKRIQEHKKHTTQAKKKKEKKKRRRYERKHSGH